MAILTKCYNNFIAITYKIYLYPFSVTRILWKKNGQRYHRDDTFSRKFPWWPTHTKSRIYDSFSWFETIPCVYMNTCIIPKNTGFSCISVVVCSGYQYKCILHESYYRIFLINLGVQWTCIPPAMLPYLYNRHKNIHFSCSIHKCVLSGCQTLLYRSYSKVAACTTPDYVPHSTIACDQTQFVYVYVHKYSIIPHHSFLAGVVEMRSYSEFSFPIFHVSSGWCILYEL